MSQNHSRCFGATEGASRSRLDTSRSGDKPALSAFQAETSFLAWWSTRIDACSESVG